MKIEFQRETSSFKLFGKIDFPAKTHKKEWINGSVISARSMRFKIFAQELDTEDEKQRLLETFKRIEKFQEDNEVKPFGLKVLSAMAICKKFKDSEEILSLGPSAMIRWKGDRRREDCESDGDIYCEYCRYML